MLKIRWNKPTNLLVIHAKYICIHVLIYGLIIWLKWVSLRFFFFHLYSPNIVIHMVCFYLFISFFFVSFVLFGQLLQIERPCHAHRSAMYPYNVCVFLAIHLLLFLFWIFAFCLILKQFSMPASQAKKRQMRYWSSGRIGKIYLLDRREKTPPPHTEPLLSPRATISPLFGDRQRTK